MALFLEKCNLKYLKNILDKAEYITISADGWWCSLGLFQRVVAYIFTDKKYSLKIGTETNYTELLGANEKSLIIREIIDE